MFLYLNKGRWGKRSFISSRELDKQLCHAADLVIEFDPSTHGGRFLIRKDRRGEALAVPIHGVPWEQGGPR
jgi:hypothetical protein